MRPKKILTLLLLPVLVCSAVGCSGSGETTGSVATSQDTAPPPGTVTVGAPADPAPAPTTEPTTQPTPSAEPTAPQPTESTSDLATLPPDEPVDGKYYLSGTWLMNETLVPLADLTGKTQVEEIREADVSFYIGEELEGDVRWQFQYLNYGDGFTSKKVEWNRNGQYEVVYSEGNAFVEKEGWQREEDRTITFFPVSLKRYEVSEEFYKWFTKNAVKIAE